MSEPMLWLGIIIGMPCGVLISVATFILIVERADRGWYD